MSLFIANARLVVPGERIVPNGIRFADGKVDAIGGAAGQARRTVIDGGSRLLTSEPVNNSPMETSKDAKLWKDGLIPGRTWIP